MLYLFKTRATMKTCYHGDLNVDPNIIPTIMIEADTLKEAIMEYAKFAASNCITISPSAIRRKQPMMVDDTHQVGYVFTAGMDFYNGYQKTVFKYINLWVEIMKVSYDIYT